MNPKRLALLVLLGLPLLSMVFIACSATSARGIQSDGALAPCPKSPNCVCSEGAGASVPPLSLPERFRGDADAAMAGLVAFLEEEPRVELIVNEPEYVHAVFRTRLLRFRDDVEFRLDRDQGVIQVRSASRLGYSDLGANKARVESIRERWASGG